MSSSQVKKIVLVGHDNYGSREIFSRIVKDHNNNASFTLFITTGLYHNRSFAYSIWKLLREASFVFCLIRFLEGLLFKIKGDTLESRARALGIEIFFTNDINSAESHKIMRERHTDLLVSMFTMQIYKQSTIDLPRYGSIGTHPSILPQYRGLEVFFWMLANQETEGGVSVFYLDRRIDAGRVFLQEKFDIYMDESVDSIYKKLTSIAARMLSDGIKLILNNHPLTFFEPKGPSSYYAMPTPDAYRKFSKTKHTWFGNPKQRGADDSADKM